MFTLLALLSLGYAAPLEHLELPGTALTVPQGELLLHPIAASSYGLTDKLTLQASPLLFLFRPHGAAVLGLFNDGHSAGAIRVGASTSWNLSSNDATVSALYTRGDPSQSTLSLSAGVGLSRTEVDDTGALAVLVPVSGTWLRSLSDHTALRVYAQVDPLDMARTKFFSGQVGGDWTYAWPRARLGLGLAVVDAEAVSVQFDTAGLDTDWVPVILPIPTLSLWWRLGGGSEG